MMGDRGNILPLLGHVYFILALFYNVVSQVFNDALKKKLAPTDPSFGILFVSVVYAIYLIGPYIPWFSYLVMMLIFIASILRFGVIKHLMNWSEQDYYARWSWFLAIAINVFGVVILPANLVFRGMPA